MKKQTVMRISLSVFGRKGEIEIFFKESPAAAAAASAAAGKAAQEALRLCRLLSAADPNSEIAQLNLCAGREYVRVSRETMHLLYQAKCRAGKTSRAFSSLFLLPQGKYGYGYDESMAADLYGGYIGGIAMIREKEDACLVSVEREAVPYTICQIRDTLQEYGIQHMRIQIGEYAWQSGGLYGSFSRQGTAFTPSLLANAAGA